MVEAPVEVAVVEEVVEATPAAEEVVEAPVEVAVVEEVVEAITEAESPTEEATPKKTEEEKPGE